VIQLVDCHVHYYGQYDVQRFLDCAAHNFRCYGGLLASADQRLGVLMLADPGGDPPFQRLASDARLAAGWTLVQTDEPTSLVARGADATLLIIAGRQIVTRERLEVLALGTADRIEPGLSLEETLRRVAVTGALAVLPWGFGKWWSKRGAAVRRLLRTTSPGDVFLGDNGARAAGLPDPAPFRLARQAGVLILPGSDPLPLSGQEERVGSYGLVLSGDLDLAAPTPDVLGRLRKAAPQCEEFGRRAAAASALKMMLRMLWRKRRANQQ
jgi:hypothetical protein